MSLRASKGRRILAAAAAFATMFTMSAAPVLAAEEITKEETVYVSTDEAGEADEIIVSDHLKNGTGADTISDRSDLTDIENVKGDETFEQGDDFALNWKAEGNDIFYQGHSDAELPVSLKISYKLDGDTVTGEELKGKSGRLVIRIDYENNETAEVKGRQVPVPFIAMTGFLVEGDSLTDIEVDNGKVIDDGDKKIVLGMAAPGLRDALKLDGKEITKDLDFDLDDTVTITATAKDYDVQDMMTVVTNSLFEDLDADDMDDLDYDDEIKELDKGAKALSDGADQLYSGLHQLDEAMPDLTDGADALNDGATQLHNGTKQALAGANSLNIGSIQLRGTLKSKMKQIGTAADQMETGSDTLLNGLKQLKGKAVPALNTTAEDLSGASQKMLNGKEQKLDPAVGLLTQGAKAAADGADALSTGAGDAQTGAKAAADGAEELKTRAKNAAQAISPVMDQDGKLNSEIAEELAEKGVSEDTITKLVTAVDVAWQENQGLIEAADGLNRASGGLSQSAGGLQKGAEGLTEASAGLTQGADGLSAAATILNDTSDQLSGASEKMSKSAEELNNKLGAYDPKLAKQGKSQTTLIGGMTVLNNGLGQLNTQVTQSISKKGVLTQALDKLVGGTGTLKDGEEQLAAGTKDLKKGTRQLKEGTEKLSDGVSQLDDGSSKLADGADELYKKGIKKIVDMYNDDLKGSIDDLKDTIDAGQEYRIYSQLADGMDGNVKFIYKTSVY